MNAKTLWLGAALLVASVTGCKEVEYIHVGPNWDAVQKVANAEQKFSVRASAETEYRVGDKVQLEVKSDRSGRLWIVQVDPNDHVELMFPNDEVTDNAIVADKTLELPPKGATWSVEVSEPVGKNLIAFIVTEGNADLRDVFGREGNASKGLQLVQALPQWAVSKYVVDIKGAQR